MKKFSTKRAAALGMTSALALGTVVSAGVMAPADADGTSPDTYHCALATGPADLPVTASLTLPSSVQSGQSLKGKAVHMSVTIDPATVAALVTGLGGIFQDTPTAIGGSATGVALPVGAGTPMALDTVAIPQTSPDSTTHVLTMQGDTTTSAYRAPLPGTYAVTMPSKFTFNPVVTFAKGGVKNLNMPFDCTSNATTPATVATLKVVKATSTTTAKLVAPATRTKRGKILSTVKAAGYAAKGKVAAFEGTKQLGRPVSLTSGKATIVLPLLKKGAHTIKVKYLGNPSAKPSTSKGVAVNVK